MQTKLAKQANKQTVKTIKQSTQNKQTDETFKKKKKIVDEKRKLPESAELSIAILHADALLERVGGVDQIFTKLQKKGAFTFFSFPVFFF